MPENNKSWLNSLDTEHLAEALVEMIIYDEFLYTRLRENNKNLENFEASKQEMIKWLNEEHK